MKQHWSTLAFIIIAIIIFLTILITMRDLLSLVRENTKDIEEIMERIKHDRVVW